MIVTCHIDYLAARCRERGYDLDEVMGCVVARTGDQVSVDVGHAAYPSKAKPGHVPSPPPTSGPGTELKKLLKTIGIVAKPGCACNKRAQTMDVNGCDWCAENLDTISSWLQEEAQKRGLPYIPAAGKWIINLAIKRARRGIGQ